MIAKKFRLNIANKANNNLKSVVEVELKGTIPFCNLENFKRSNRSELLTTSVESYVDSLDFDISDINILFIFNHPITHVTIALCEKDGYLLILPALNLLPSPSEGNINKIYKITGYNLGKITEANEEADLIMTYNEERNIKFSNIVFEQLASEAKMFNISGVKKTNYTKANISLDMTGGSYRIDQESGVIYLELNTTAMTIENSDYLPGIEIIPSTINSYDVGHTRNINNGNTISFLLNI